MLSNSHAFVLFCFVLFCFVFTETELTNEAFAQQYRLFLNNSIRSICMCTSARSICICTIRKLDKRDSYLCQVILLLTFMLFYPVNPPVKQRTSQQVSTSSYYLCILALSRIL